METEKLSRDATTNILIAILRRAIQDASGPEPVDRWATYKDQVKAREYLTRGYIKEQGYHYYEIPAEEAQSNLIRMPNVKKNVSEKKQEKFQQTDEPQYSPITLKDILDYTDIDRSCFDVLISQWEDANWDREFPWYIKFLYETKSLDE